MIYTSYFAKTMKLSRDKYVIVGITRFPPNWFRGKNIEMLAPSKELLLKWKNNEISEEDYKLWYMSDLDANKDEIKTVFKILNAPYEKDIVLCCYEKSDSLCHRHLLSEWLSKNIGLEVKEL